MQAAFQEYIRQHISLSDQDVQLMLSLATEQKVSKKTFLLREGEVCRHKMFVTGGLLRIYRTREDGSEHIIQFSPEQYWCTEPESLNKQTPSSYYIDAVEDSHLLQWTKKDFDHLNANIPGLKAYSEGIIAHNMDLHRQRIFSAISATPEEKYDEFMRVYPGLLSRIPLHMVASYLGVSVKTLTRIRHAQLQR
ncbi:Crp/Fnr family transcriptional regulator [Mucilaginibacter myungsuensis]|uniref:Crp/Fnr family transcriptional regulator n=1 Tax=Mucilaginibacter myungsuensis TaxID=649104 RepID=A0A929L0C5_9SPHI|nr:Crp/Fnr family transcriptional regulator [Mucilaginibacter myungsuensis]MBE9663917.1 Crp/Fnr family transcriptional regulator [Mucilaginibacter myungsuensis]MDN3598367.1 Crp/Fnr family transcriptional regulator [Mucilaginibacter myungsuensis]